jgi:hypothetical protein
LDWTKRWEDSLGPESDVPQAVVVGSIVEAQGGEITLVIQDVNNPPLEEATPTQEPPVEEPPVEEVIVEGLP